MDTPTFRIGEALGFGWRTFRDNLWLMVGAVAIVMVAGYAPAIFTWIVGDDSALVVLAASVLGYVLSLFIALGYTRLALRLVDGQPGAIGDLFSCGRLVVRMVLASLLYMLIVMGGTILLIVPGMIWAIKFQYYMYAIVDEDAGVMESLRRSSAITRGEKFHLFGFGLVAGLVGMVGLLVLVVGVLASGAVVALAYAHVYRRLTTMHAERSAAAD